MMIILLFSPVLEKTAIPILEIYREAERIVASFMRCGDPIESDEERQ